MILAKVKLIVLLIGVVGVIGCSTLAKKNDTGVIVARRAQIRSSTAVVAADLLEVNRGDSVDILDSIDVADPTDNTKKERWLRVRAHNDQSTSPACSGSGGILKSTWRLGQALPTPSSGWCLDLCCCGPGAFGSYCLSGN